MSPVLFLAIIPPLIWAAGNHGDKYSVEQYMRGRDPASLIIFTGISALIFALGILLFGFVSATPLLFAVLITLSGVVLVASYVPYMYALKIDEATNTAPLFQLVTPWVYLLGLLFLGERLPFLKLCAGSLIFFGAIILSLDSEDRRIRRKTFLLMLLASAMIAGNVIVFKYFGLKTDFWTTAFYDMIGTAIGGLVLFCIPRYRRDLFSAVREHASAVVILSMAIELCGISARLLYGFITLAVPIALVQFVTGLQPLFTLFFGIVLTKWLPRFGVETIDRRNLTRKFSAILLMVTGIVLLCIFS